MGLTEDRSAARDPLKVFCKGGTKTCEDCVGSCGIEEYEASAAETSHVHKWVDKALLHEPSLKVCECGATLTNREYRNSDAANEPDPATLSVTQDGIGDTSGFFLPPCGGETSAATGSESLLVGRRAVLADPLCDVALAPDAAGGQFADGLRKARNARDLIGSLAADAKEGCDLSDSDKLHLDTLYPLTASSARRSLPLDSVKRREMSKTHETTEGRGRVRLSDLERGERYFSINSAAGACVYRTRNETEAREIVARNASRLSYTEHQR